MCIRDRARTDNLRITQHAHQEMVAEEITLDQLQEAIGTSELLENYPQHQQGCLLYTSDAADERSSVDLGGRRIIKKKKKREPQRTR